MEILANLKKMDLDRFTRLYVRAAEGRLALQERRMQGEYLCCFFDPVEVRCTVYAVRPEQCRTYPFWEPFRKDADKLQFECPGVSLLAIQKRR